MPGTWHSQSLTHTCTQTHAHTHTYAAFANPTRCLPPCLCSDVHLELKDQRLGTMTGTLHFIKFATARMEGFMRMVNDNGLTDFSKAVCATGGGAYKYEKEFKEVRMVVRVWVIVRVIVKVTV